jgi:N-acylneuraminate cytidylyltransferase/CMP-N,N'-diacetyllegionaminic acid synthase
VRLFEKGGASNLISGTPARGSPYFNLVEVDNKGVARLSKLLNKPVFRRQDSPPCYDINGSIYIWRRDALLRSGPTVFLEDTMLYVMPEERSIDINTEFDFGIVEFLLTKREALQTKEGLSTL